MEIAYSGTAYHGWQKQPETDSIQGHIERAISLLTGRPVDITGAGRTDTGVHAEQMYAHFDIPPDEWKMDNLIYRLNAFLPNDIVIKDIFPVIPEAHARFDALRRSYEYRIFLGKNPFLTPYTWQIYGKVNMEDMNKAASILLKYKDFKSFSKTNTDVKTYLCHITRAEWIRQGNLLVFHISADRFLRNMVRAITGTLWEIGTGKRSLEDFPQIIESRNRSSAGPSVPARGLFLTKVEYDFKKLRIKD